MQTVSDANPSEASVADPDSLILARADSVNRAKQQAAPVKLPSAAEQPRTSSTTKHPIRSVASYTDAFPDMQDVQIQAANKFGVSPVQNRAEAERRKMELVYVGANPYFFVEPLRSSIPYLVPRASVLLQDIGRNFFDSLQIKGVPLNKIIVTSVLRSKDVCRSTKLLSPACFEAKTTSTVCVVSMAMPPKTRATSTALLSTFATTVTKP